MSELALKTAFATGTPSTTVWTQAHTFAHMFLIVVLEKGDPGGQTNLAAAGKALFLATQERYERLPVKNLKMFQTLFSDLDVPADLRLTSLLAGMVAGQTLYVGALGGEVHLVRGGQVGKILTGGGQMVFASGFLEDSDIVSFFTSDLAAELDFEKEKELFSLDAPIEIAESISPIIHKIERQAWCGGLVVKIAQTLPSQIASVAQELPEEKQVESKVARVSVTVVILLVVLFLFSLIFGARKRVQDARLASFTTAYQQAQSKYDEGAALSDLNPILAQRTLTGAKELVASQLAEKNLGKSQKEQLRELDKKIEEKLQIALRIETLADVPLYFDLILIKEGASAQTMSYSQDSGRIALLDTKANALYTLSVPNKQGTFVGANFAAPKHEAVLLGQGFVLDDNGIEQITFTEQKPELVIEKDDGWGDIGALAAFGGNLYLLDKTNGSIYKYPGQDSGFGLRRDYITQGAKPDFSKSVDMAIDGAVWVLFGDGRISRYVQGSQESVSLSGLDKPFNNPTSLFADSESEAIYILDWGNKRVVVAKKDGTYTSQYLWEGIKDVTDMVVSEKEKKIFLLAGSKIYAVPL